MMSRVGLQGSDAKYFQTTKKGEIHDLKMDLNSFNKDKIKEAGRGHNTDPWLDWVLIGGFAIFSEESDRCDDRW